MVPARYDVIVLGVGAMGSATLYQLARRGKRVLGLERYDIPHAMGSSHGHTRIIRLAYSEDPSYVLLLQRSYELWRSIQATAGEQLLHITGSVDAGPPDSWVFTGSLESCLQHELPHQVLTSKELTERFPGYRLPQETLAVLQPDGGFLLPERCIVAHVTAAQAEGAEVHGRERVLEWLPLGDGVRVITDHGVYESDHLVVTAGAWNAKLLPLLEGVAVPERQVLAWLQPRRPELFTPDRFPVFNLLVEEGRFYGLPSFGVPGFKLGRYHHLEEAVDPDQLEREPRRDDEDLLRGFATRYFPDGAGPTMSLAVCMFTNTADNHFVIDRHPDYPQVSFASPCSGHGFKFASVIGEIMADLAEHGTTRHNIELFRLDRLVDQRSND
jgi:sarcosine oxidase